MEEEVALQRRYYARTAERYEDMHGADEFAPGLAFLSGAIEWLKIRSVLDIGSGTGRTLRQLKAKFPELRVMGIEPSEELREIGYRSGVSRSDLVDGDARALAFDDRAFDLVCEFGALHHIPAPDLAVAEMLRVSRRAIFICDGNNFGQGSAPVRAVKHLLRALRLWKLADFVKTRGKGYSITEGDGVAYSYSVFSNWKQIARACHPIHVVNTDGDGRAASWSASGIALLGIKRPA